MIWISIIIGLLSFVLQIYVLKHTWADSGEGLAEFRWEYAEKLSIPLWVALLMLLCCIIPVLNIIESILFWVEWYDNYAQAENYNSRNYYIYWRFKDEFLSRKI